VILMAGSESRPGWGSGLLTGVGALIGTGIAVLAMWLGGWEMVERAAGPITAWVFTALIVLAGALWGIRSGVRLARLLGSPKGQGRVPDAEAE
jgi:hypothetical protein